MSTLLLSLLLLVLITMGLLMGRKVAEHFADAPAAPQMSPALANLLATPALVAATQKPVPSVDKLERDKEVVAAAEAVAHPPPPALCPKCPVCPDMSQYVRLDEVPCWNCTLP